MFNFLFSTFFCLQVPSGWTSSADGRILYQQEHPEKGEIFQVKTNSKELHQLGFAIMNRDLELVQGKFDPHGYAILQLATHEAIARWSDKEKQWTILVFSPEHKSLHNYEEVFAQALEDKDTEVWGGASKPEWQPKADGATWSRDPKLTGIWRANRTINGRSMVVTAQFENDGTFRLEKKNADNADILSGYWMTSKEKIQFQYATQNVTSDYRYMGSSLQFEVDGVSLIFYKK